MQEPALTRNAFNRCGFTAYNIIALMSISIVKLSW